MSKKAKSKNKEVFYQPIMTAEEFIKNDLASFMVYRKFENAKTDYPKHTIGAFTENEIEEPTFVDDEDDRTETFYVDVPPSNGSDEWHIVTSFKTKQEAVDFAKEKFGADNEGNVCLVNAS